MLHTGYCTKNAVHSILQSEYCTYDNVNSILHTANYALSTEPWTMNRAHIALNSSQINNWTICPSVYRTGAKVTFKYWF